VTPSSRYDAQCSGHYQNCGLMGIRRNKPGVVVFEIEELISIGPGSWVADAMVTFVEDFSRLSIC